MGHEIGDRVPGCPVCRDEGEGCGACIIGSGWGAGEAEIARDAEYTARELTEQGISCTAAEILELWSGYGVELGGEGAF